MTFRLLVINPNSDERVTDHLRDVCRRVLPPGSEVEATQCPDAPSVLETALDSVAAAPAVLRAALRADHPDAYLIACFGNPAVAALRELTDRPVLGLGEAALIEASLLTGRFGLVTTLERGIPALWNQLQTAGRERSCAGIRSAEEATRGSPAEDSLDEQMASALVEQGERLLVAGADGLVLACAAFGPLRGRIATELGVPVCDGIALGASLTSGLFAAGARTSKRGVYAWPDRGVLARYREAGGLLSAADNQH